MEKMVIKEYNATEAALSELKATLTGLRYEVSTTEGMDTAKRDRRTLVVLRTSLEKRRKEIKAPALAHCKLIDEEAKRITSEIKDIEEPIDAQIKVEEKKKAEEKAERERIAAEAQKILDDKILEISKLPLRCVGKNAGEITLFIATMEAREIGVEFIGETRDRAIIAKQEAVTEMRSILITQEAVEQEEATRKAQAEEEAVQREVARIKQEEEDAIKQAELDEQSSEIARLKGITDAKTEALRIEREKAAEVAKKAEADRKAREEKEALDAEAKRQADAEAKRQREVVANAEAERKAAKKKAALLAAKCKNSIEAFRKILAITQDSNKESEEAIVEIALIAEANM